MKISYPEQHDQAIPRGAPSQGPLILIVGFLAFVALTGIVIWWFSSQKEIAPPTTAPAPVSLPREFKQKPFDPADGMTQCVTQTPDIGSEENQAKREKCYRAVMIIFGTSNICAAHSLDSSSQVLCMRAQASYESDRQSGKLPSGPVDATVADLTGAPVVSNGTTNTVLAQSLSGTSFNNSQNGGGGTVTHTTNTSGGTNTVSNNTTPPGGMNTNTSFNTNSSNENTNTFGNTNQNPPSNTNQTPPTSTTTTGQLCLNALGEIILLQHTNTCE